MTEVEKALKKGGELANANEYDKAVGIYEAGLKIVPDNRELLYAQAKAFFKLKDFKKALSNFDLLVDKFPGQADLISERAVLYHHLGDNSKALEELNVAASLEPENPFRYSSRAWIKAALKDTKGAIADYDKAIELDPEDAISYNNKGLLEDQLGYKKASIQSFEKSNELTGYKPELNLSDISKGKSERTEKEEALKNGEAGENRLTSSGYAKTLKGILTNKQERKEFFSFIKNLGK